MQQKYQTIAFNLSNWYAFRAKRIFTLTLIAFAASFAVYMFFMVTSLSQGVAHQQIKRDIKNSESKIAQLEADRIARMKSVDLAFAKDRGFVEVSPTRYISKNSATERFTMRNVR